MLCVIFLSVPLQTDIFTITTGLNARLQGQDKNKCYATTDAEKTIKNHQKQWLCNQI